MSVLPSSDCLTARAVVKRSDGPEGLLELEFLDEPRCRGCEGVCLWRRMPVARRMHLAPSPDLDAGDPVLVSLPARVVLLGALLLYGLPWAALVLGALAGALLAGTDLAVLLGAGIGITVALALAPRLRAKLERVTAAEIKLHAPV